MALQDLNELQWAALAGQELQPGREQDIAVESMRHFYNQFTIRGRPAGQDPGLAGILMQAAQGAAAGHGVGPLLGNAINLYGGEYTQQYATSTLGDIRANVVASGFNAFRPGFDAYVNAHANETYVQVAQRVQTARAAGANPNPEDLSALAALGVLETQKFRGQMYPSLVRERTDRELARIHP